MVLRCQFQGGDRPGREAIPRSEIYVLLRPEVPVIGISSGPFACLDSKSTRGHVRAQDRP